MASATRSRACRCAMPLRMKRIRSCHRARSRAVLRAMYSWSASGLSKTAALGSLIDFLLTVSPPSLFLRIRQTVAENAQELHADGRLAVEDFVEIGGAEHQCIHPAFSRRYRRG